MRHLARAALVSVLSLSLAGSALAQSDDLKSTSLVPPDSPLFFVQRLLDSWEEFLAFEEIDEARVQAKISRNRLAEAAAVLKAGKAELAAEISAEMADRVGKAAAELAKAQRKAEQAKAKAEEAKAKGDAQRARGEEANAKTRQEAIDHVLAQLGKNDEHRQQALQAVLDKVQNERARAAIQTAMERSKKGLETAAKNVSNERGSKERGKPETTGRPESTSTGSPATSPRTMGAPTTTSAPRAAPTAPVTGRPTGPAGRP